MGFRAFIAVILCLVMTSLLAAEPGENRLLPGQDLHAVHSGDSETKLIAMTKGRVERRAGILTIWASGTTGYAFRNWHVPESAAHETFSYGGGGQHYHLVHHTYCHDSPDIMVIGATGLHVSAHLGEDEPVLSPSGLRLAVARSYDGGQKSAVPLLRIWRLDTGEEVLTCRQAPDGQLRRTAHVVEFTDDYLEVIIREQATSPLVPGSTLHMARIGRWRLADGAAPVAGFTCAVPPE